MQPYQPLSVASISKTGPAAFENMTPFPQGAQVYRGLPFEIGDGKGNVIGLGKGLDESPLLIPIDAAVRHVIFAHRLMDSGIPENEGLGEVCAEYVFQYASGAEERVPIRDRFEIGCIPIDWGQWPLLCVPDENESLWEREQGKWSHAGSRQLETILPWAKEYYLYYWSNPHPELPLKSLAIAPRGPRLLIGGITLSSLEEPPIVRAARRPVKITLLKEEEAQAKGNLKVEVDRGVATYPYSLPKASKEEFLNDTHKGWGEKFNSRVSPSYVEIAANPSATITINQGEQALGSVNWGEVEDKGKVESGERVRIELADPGRNWVKTTVLDEETGQPLPCRIHFRSPEGIPYQPHGHHGHVNSNNGTWHFDIGGDVRLGQITYAYIRGECEGWLPRGEVIVDAAHGYEYEPLRTTIKIEPGQQSLVLKMKRMADLRKEHFYAGDTHVHFVSTQGAHLEASCEGVHVVNLMQSQWGHLFTNTEEFTGEPSVSKNGETIIYASQENRQHILGHLSLMGLKKPVMPWCSGGPDESDLGGSVETTLSHWADECHAQGGTVIIPHMPTPNGDPSTLIATGRADAVEFLVFGQNMHKEYYRYLNCGYRLPIVGGTDKMDSGVPIGIYRTYVQIPNDEEFNYENWCRNLRRGRTYMTSGPLLQFQVEGQGIGSEIHLPQGGGSVETEVLARSILPIHSLELVMNGKVVDRVEESKGTHLLSLKSRIPVERHSWIAARCAGPGYSGVTHHDSWQRGIMAHTSPVYLSVGDAWEMFDPGVANYMLTLMQGCLDYVRNWSPQWKKGEVTHHHHFSQDHLHYLEEPYIQAMKTVHERMHRHGIPH